MAIDAKKVNVANVEMRTEENTVFISGTIDVPKPGEFMLPFLEEVHNNIISKKIKKVEADLQNLEFLNSSGIKELVSWLLKLEELSSNQIYTIVFIYNPSISWQEMSLQTLILLNEEQVELKAMS